MTNDADQRRGLALQDAADHLRRARAAVAAAAEGEQQEARRVRLVQLHAVVADTLEQAQRLQP